MVKIIRKSAVSGTVRVPCSKSYAQRSLAAALLADGESVFDNIELCDDTKYAMNVIGTLGARVLHIEEQRYSVMGGLNPKADVINIGESGLATRMFTPIASLNRREITVSGHGTMRNRTIDMMIEPLRNLGVRVVSDGYLPISVKGPIQGGETEVDGRVSSQFVTGLLIALPRAGSDTTLHVKKPASIPYIEMTLDVVRRFGIRIEHDAYKEFYIAGNQNYVPTGYAIEGDWSAAAFFLVAGAIAGQITLSNMNSLSKQADTELMKVLSYAGARITTMDNDISVSCNNLDAFEFDATHCPDLFPILAALAANCRGTSRIQGASRLIYKESNRARAIVSEFSKLGVKVAIHNDLMTVKGGEIRGGEIDSHSDHRIAMAGAIAGLTSSSPVTITNPEVVSKSYPRFWEDLEMVTQSAQALRN